MAFSYDFHYGKVELSIYKHVRKQLYRRKGDGGGGYIFSDA